MNAGITTAKAPGKLILCGEHAVVHGCLAVAMAVNRFAECEVAARDVPRLLIEAPDFCTHVEVSLEEAQAVASNVHRRYQEFLDGKRMIRDVLDDSGQLLIFAVMRALEEPGSAKPRLGGGLQVRIRTDIPVGCGMGSSAAVASALIQAVGRHTGQRFSQADLYERVMDCERLQHGHPSGVDAYASIYGGCMTYRRGGEIRPLPLKNVEWALVHTGAPAASTGECVAQVKERFSGSDLWPKFERVAQEMASALTGGKSDRVVTLIRENHRLLVRIGVVPDPVQRFVRSVEERGGAAKICGAGSIRGDGAGMVWVVSEIPVAAWCADWGYSAMTVRLPDSGD